MAHKVGACASVPGILVIWMIMLAVGADSSFHRFDDETATQRLPHFADGGDGRGINKEMARIEMQPPRPWNRSAMLALRTAFHFQPPAHWMNDPDAPLYYGGWYHLFYQYNPAAAYWGNISWGHAVSRDLVRWRNVRQLAMVPDHWYDADGVWTGSATILPNGTPAVLYTGSSATADSAQLQNLAVPAPGSGDLLLNWTKYVNNPVIYPPPDINVTDFRDPSTAWRHTRAAERLIDSRNRDAADEYDWIISIGSQNRSDNRTGMALLYRSPDFVSWSQLPRPLHSVAGTGMWECVDFYPVLGSGSPEGVDQTGPPAAVDSLKHVLKISIDDEHIDYYAVGEYGEGDDGPYFTPESPELDIGRGYRYDLGRYYASKSFYDPVGRRRVLFGWVNESDTRYDDIAKGWAGVQAIPRQIWFDNQTQESLIQWPIEEITSLRESNITLGNIILESGSIMSIEEAEGAQWDITINFENPLDGLFDLSTQFPIIKLEQSSIGCNTNGADHVGIFGPFGIFVLSSHDLQERTGVYFYFYPIQSQNEEIAWKIVVCNDLTRSSLASDVDDGVHGGPVVVLDKEFDLTLRILVDHSIVETFAQGGRATITSRVYPTIALNESANLFLFNNGSTPILLKHFEAWKLSNIHLQDNTT